MPPDQRVSQMRSTLDLISPVIIVAGVVAGNGGCVEFGDDSSVFLRGVRGESGTGLFNVLLDKFSDCFYSDREVKLVQFQMA